ncbi:transcriptional regulator [Actinomadura sp. 3N407]|uniref:transcriptional regulator n=1 Tax=Actinomadura sp. 3N407 TaxID=3457423 RepID=UPI003FCCC80A
MSLGRIGGVYAALNSASIWADHVVQSGDDAQAKAGHGWPARAACARHVAELTAVQIVALAGVSAVAGERLKARRVVAGLAFNAATHYLLDRRPFAQRLAYALGKGAFYDEFPVQRETWLDRHGPGSGPNALDQSWHVGLLAITAAIIAGKD